MDKAKKRSVVDIERLSRLKSKQYLYTISCCVNHMCICKKESQVCLRGFFSLFIEAMNGIDFAIRNDISCHINFGDMPYLYSDPKKYDGDLNFWNYYFEQPFDISEKENGTAILNDMFETYPLRIWDRRYFRRLNIAIEKHLRFKNPLKTALEEKSTLFERYNIIGVHIRRTDHSSEVEPISMTKILKTIESELKEFDKVFVATDDSNIIEILKKNISEKRILYNHVIRSDNNKAVHINMKNTDRYQLGFDAILDCYCLSLCDKTILTHSNFSYASLFFNPEQPYILLETRKSKFKRLKTLLVYHLDRLGIRKW